MAVFYRYYHPLAKAKSITLSNIIQYQQYLSKKNNLTNNFEFIITAALVVLETFHKVIMVCYKRHL